MSFEYREKDFVYDPSACRLCPRRCSGDRTNRGGKVPFCLSGDEIRVARADLHFWEEPCISGEKGSGAVFFSGCSLGCVYCQNYDISHNYYGKDITGERFEEILFELKDKGAHNINLVTADAFMPYIVPVIKRVKNKLDLPIVYNCSGYQSLEILSLAKEIVDIYLVDVKYFDSTVSEKYSFANEYYSVAVKSLDEMVKIGKSVYDSDGMMKKGVIVRHMVIPSQSKDSETIIHSLYERYGNDKFLLSLMSQYTPNGNPLSPSRSLTHFEYNRALKAMETCGFDGYIQEFSSQGKSYTPPFDLSGV